MKLPRRSTAQSVRTIRAVNTAFDRCAAGKMNALNAIEKSRSRARSRQRRLRRMHDGRLATIDDVVEFYSRGGRQNTNLDPALRPENFTSEEKRALLAFQGWNN